MIPYLREIIIILIAAGILVPLCMRMKMSPVLGYLFVGVLVGPFGIAAMAPSEAIHYLTIDDAVDVSHLAELGIVFLMFMIGLELSPQRLWAMRKMVFGLGLLQVVVTLGLISVLVETVFGVGLLLSLVIGAALALSSTAVVMQILTDRHLIATPVGRSCFSILLFQDIAVVPILILIGLLGVGVSDGLGMALLWAMGKALLAILVLALAGYFLLRPVFRIAGSAKSAEPFMAVTLLTVIVAAAVTGMAGLSMALGAFLGGLMLAETEYRHAIEVYIEPFKGLLLGLFFMTVGMGVDLSVLRANALEVGAGVVGLIVLKTLLVSLLGMLFGLTRADAVKTGMLLGQAGEFAFVIIGAAMTAGLMPAPIGQFLLLVAGLSMAATPFIAILARSVGRWLAAPQGVQVYDAPESIPEMHDHVLIAGFGRVGKAVASILAAEGVPYLALEANAEAIAEPRKSGLPVIYGDLLNEGFLRHCHPEKAQAVLVTMADTAVAMQIIKTLRQHWPDLAIYSRAQDLKSAQALRAAGGTVVVAETIEASLQLASSLLQGIGADEDVVSRRMALSREYAMNRIQGME